MSINIFQFLKQGTSLNRQSLQRNEKLHQVITPKVRAKNQLYLSTGNFHETQQQQKVSKVSKIGTFLKRKKSEQLQAEQNRHRQRMAQLRKTNQIKVQGDNVPDLCSTFREITDRYEMSEQVKKGIAEMGYRKPTPVQMQVISCLIEGRNTLVTAPTGTGKTFAFLLPILHSLRKNVSKKLEAVIFTPSQQLSTQIHNQINILLTHCESPKAQCISKLSQKQKVRISHFKSPGFNILITTPLAFLHTFPTSQHKKLLRWLKYVILDECDKYFQQSFLSQIKQILAMLDQCKSVFGLFSATIQHPVEELLRESLLDDCVRVEIGGRNRVLDKIRQTIEYCTNQYGKVIELRNMIAENRFIPPVLIFVQERVRARQLYYQMKKMLRQGMNMADKLEVLTGDKDKNERQHIISRFETGDLWVLITTDIAARGIDFSNVNLVINYDFPNSMLTYIHRVGRTARAERDGAAVTFFTDEDKPLVRSLGNLLKVSGCQIPQWILEMPKIKKSAKKKLQHYPVKRLPVGVAEGRDRQWQQQLQIIDKRWQKDKLKEEKRQSEDNQDEWIQT